ncbi:hypothetical protein ANCCEY_02258 [Ancylostoma ceylanicum]|uniref:DUF7153 domain-containing protein n=1 Tax=Ancylostoma ceylanicum TaxID=53326 RepID=A0A0D6M2Z3_9BILA|nr:hypothetical protein ANCCEY_02258 [Ancylostoma ceylanicum]
MFPYLHFSQFQSPDHAQRQGEIDGLIRECRVYPAMFPYLHFSQFQSPDHAQRQGEIDGLIRECRQQNLEKSWLSWSGAREIYKHSPRTWNLRRISLRRCLSTTRSSSRPFAYILMCEFGSILHPSNTLQALDMCERLRVRNCGHIALYQVHTSYSASSSCSRKVYSNSLAAAKRQAMIRGFSHDVETPPPVSTEERRSRMRMREHSFQYPDEHYTAYQ